MNIYKSIGIEFNGNRFITKTVNVERYLDEHQTDHGKPCRTGSIITKNYYVKVIKNISYIYNYILTNIVLINNLNLIYQ